MSELWDGSSSYLDPWTMANEMYRMPKSEAGNGAMKVKVFKDHNISMDGVESIWVMECPHRGCAHLQKNYGEFVFWENALFAARRHVKWHRSFNANV